MSLANERRASTSDNYAHVPATHGEGHGWLAGVALRKHFEDAGYDGYQVGVYWNMGALAHWHIGVSVYCESYYGGKTGLLGAWDCGILVRHGLLGGGLRRTLGVFELIIPCAIRATSHYASEHNNPRRVTSTGCNKMLAHAAMGADNTRLSWF